MKQHLMTPALQNLLCDEYEPMLVHSVEKFRDALEARKKRKQSNMLELLFASLVVVLIQLEYVSLSSTVAKFEGDQARFCTSP